ncbi:MAG: AAA family ATPase [Chlamydiia bacterium]|nr:AAA family ATPase [Chlamydiia bacterium]
MTSLATQLKTQQTSAAVDQWLQHPIAHPLRDIDQAPNNFKESLPEGLHQEAKNLLTQAEYFLSKTDKLHLHHPSYLRELFELLIVFIEMLLDVFGITALFGSKDYEWQEQQKSYQIMNLISFIGMFSSQVLPLIGIEEGQKKVAIVLTALMGLSLIYPRIQPTPRHLPKGQNLTKAIQKGDVEVLDGNKKVLDLMAMALKNKKKVMLVGPSGIGKTETAKAFAEAILRGDYPELKGLTSFYYNTADIVDSFGGNLIGRINDKVGNNRDNILFVWDEFHIACKGRLADQMKTIFDPGPRSFPYAIVITTDKELEDFEKTNQGALLRRFEQIHLKHLTDEELKVLLGDLILRQMPEVTITTPQETLDYLIKTCNEKLPIKQFTPYQVHNAIEVLKQCFEYIGESQYTPPGEEFLQKQQQHRTQIAMNTLDFSGTKSPTQIEQPKEISDDKFEAKQAFFLRRKQLLAIKRAFCALTCTLSKSKTPKEKDLKKFHLMNQFIIPQMEKNLISKAQELGLKTIIDNALIDQAITEISAKRKPLKATT